MSISAISPKLRVRRSEDRGYANHGWLDSHHTFSFAMYYDPKYDGWSSLRVINEDRVSPSNGFGTHGHRDFEIFSYVLSGALEHKDSLNNKEVLRRGDVQVNNYTALKLWNCLFFVQLHLTIFSCFDQFTSAGSGIRHSEYNHSDKEEVHFLQCWIQPSKKGIKPSYQTRHFSEDDKRGTDPSCPLLFTPLSISFSSIFFIPLNPNINSPPNRQALLDSGSI